MARIREVVLTKQETKILNDRGPFTTEEVTSARVYADLVDRRLASAHFLAIDEGEEPGWYFKALPLRGR